MIRGFVLGVLFGVGAFVAGLHLWELTPLFSRIAIQALQAAGYPITVG